MMEYLHTNRHIDIFYLITSDSDFRHVIHKIREYNKKVHCIGNSTMTSCLVPVCNKYTRISVLKMKEEFSNITSPIQLSKTPAMKKRKKITMISDPNTYSISRYSIIINNIIKPRMRYHLSFISDELLKNYPDFDYKIYGTNTFSKFILKYYKNVIRLSKSLLRAHYHLIELIPFLRLYCPVQNLSREYLQLHLRH